MFIMFNYSLAQYMLVFSLTEQHWLTVFENMLLMIFGHKNDEVTSGSRGLHNEVFCDLYTSLNVIRSHFKFMLPRVDADFLLITNQTHYLSKFILS